MDGYHNYIYPRCLWWKGAASSMKCFCKLTFKRSYSSHETYDKMHKYQIPGEAKCINKLRVLQYTALWCLSMGLFEYQSVIFPADCIIISKKVYSLTEWKCQPCVYLSSLDELVIIRQHLKALQWRSRWRHISHMDDISVFIFTVFYLVIPAIAFQTICEM